MTIWSTRNASGSSGPVDSLELEDEDGGPVPVGATELIEALRHAGRPVPLILLSACSGGSSGAEALAAGLIRRRADRVIAMQAPVADPYATALAASFYRELVEDPSQPVRQALTRARRDAEHHLSATRRNACGCPRCVTSTPRTAGCCTGPWAAIPG